MLFICKIYICSVGHYSTRTNVNVDFILKMRTEVPPLAVSSLTHPCFVLKVSRVWFSDWSPALCLLKRLHASGPEIRVWEAVYRSLVLSGFSVQDSVFRTRSAGLCLQDSVCRVVVSCWGCIMCAALRRRMWCDGQAVKPPLWWF